MTAAIAPCVGGVLWTKIMSALMWTAFSRNIAFIRTYLIARRIGFLPSL